jgi:hypothetical protein
MRSMRAYDFYSLLQGDRFSLIYMGEFDDDLTSLLMRIQETSSDEGRSTKKRVSYLIAECFQNIIRHTDEETDERAEFTRKMFLMRNVKGTHYLASTNPVENDHVDPLINSIESLKKLSEEELKKLYLMALGNNVLSEKGGGGLGLIEMARKTKNAPQYHFKPINEEYSNFFLQLVMDGESAEDKHVEVDDVVRLYDEMVRENIVLLRKGDFSQESILPLFQLFESNLQLKKEDLVFKKKSLYILIELLQNMNRHAVPVNGSKEGLFMISMEDNSYTMETGNFISNEDAESLKNHLESLQGLDKIALAKRYKEQLLNNSIHEDQGAGIGIIEMFRQSDGELKFEFKKVDEKNSFVSLKATL